MNILYVKASVERRPEYRQLTMIVEESGERFALKAAAGPEATAHVNSYVRNRELLQEKLQSAGRIGILPCEKREEGKVAFPFLRENTLADRLTETTAEEYLEQVLQFRQALINAFPKAEAEEEPLRTVFGEAPLPGAREGFPVSDLDMNFENVYLTDGDTYTLIDYEWVFPFCIPLVYILYRSVQSDITFSRFTAEKQHHILAGLGLDKEDAERCRQMELAFQQYVALPEEKLDYFISEKRINGTECMSLDEILALKSEKAKLAGDVEEYKAAYDRQQEAIHTLDSRLEEYKAAYDRQQEAIHTLDSQLEEYKAAYDRQQEAIHTLDSLLEEHKAANDRQQETILSLDGKLQEYRRLYDELAAKWYVRIPRKLFRRRA